MKFAQYLRETQAPEWKRAYIDYRGLKKCIAAIRKAQQGSNFNISTADSSDEQPSPPTSPRPSDMSFQPAIQPSSPEDSSNNAVKAKPSERMAYGETSGVIGSFDIGRSGLGDNTSSKPFQDRKSSYRGRASFALPSVLLSRTTKGSSRSNGNGPQPRSANPLAALPLHELLTHLTPNEVSFFTMLDAQLDKVESFYIVREKEMLDRGHLLQIQLNELSDHRKLFLESHAKASWLASFAASLKATLKIRQESFESIEELAAGGGQSAFSGVPPIIPKTEGVYCQSPSASTSALAKPTLVSSGKQKDAGYESSNESMEEPQNEEDHHRMPLSADPDNYLYAKGKLKKAVLEYYRGLEVLHNYRVLNITGFRKALKKFQKVTKIPAQHQYMTEKVERSAFASDKAIKAMMTRMEEMYAAAFARGDKKRATRRLRSGTPSNSHHFSTFRSGILFGLAIPALIDGLVKAFQHETQIAMPSWDILLYLYSIILIPSVFSLLVGVNLLVWAKSRINYVFIFELDILTRLDHRKYFEMPSLLFSTLCYSFWLSFARIGAPRMEPSIWLLIWLAFMLIVLCDPLPVYFRSSRFWLVRSVAKLFISGTRPVEFHDFWLGDQFCSLTFTISNLFLFVCVYVDGFSVEWAKCNPSGQHWPIAFALASIPLLIRLVQSIKRYIDSRLVTHLINGGKYGTGIINNFFYFLWRHHSNGSRGKWFVLWCLFNTCYSVYAGSWDLLMDWSLLRLDSKNYLLRDDLIYTDHIYMYYFAIVSNTLTRFIWVIYIPHGGINTMVRGFIAAFVEILRRWQWNFYRLENEHLGNMDQYRVTREVPLPYSSDDVHHEKDDDDDDEHRYKAKR